MRIISSSTAQTQKIGVLLAKLLAKKDVITLSGELGSGKTIFVKGIAGGLGFPPKRVLSSSFVLMRVYPAKRFPLYHFDLYRIKNYRDIYGLGYEEYLGAEGVCAIEWAQRIERLLTCGYLEIKIKILDENKRELIFLPHGARYKRILKSLKNEYFSA